MISTIVFSFEMIIKIISLGFINNGEYSYLRQIENVFGND